MWTTIRGGDTEMIINQISLELESIGGFQHAFLGCIMLNDFDTYSLDKCLHFVGFDMSETFLFTDGLFLIVRQKTS